MFFVLKRNKILFEKIENYLKSSEIVIDNFQKSIKHFLKNGIDSEFEILMEMTNSNEGKADDLLAEIKVSLYQKSLLPESREDILIILDRVDDIVDKSNHVLQSIYSQNIEIPKFIKDDFKEIIKISIKAFLLLKSSVDQLLTKKSDKLDNSRLIDNYESACDSLQLKMIKKVFDSDISEYCKIIVRDVIRDIGTISDLCEDADNIITVLNIKRAI
ncbi:MAG: DUF47 family protein [Spirochaetes bacterium]|nr:DUF47 family protein [Spirochaetota bacterium]